MATKNKRGSKMFSITRRDLRIAEALLKKSAEKNKKGFDMVEFKSQNAGLLQAILESMFQYAEYKILSMYANQK